MNLQVPYQQLNTRMFQMSRGCACNPNPEIHISVTLHFRSDLALSMAAIHSSGALEGVAANSPRIWSSQFHFCTRLQYQ